MDYGNLPQNITPESGTQGYPYTEFQEILNKDGYDLVFNLPGTSAGTAANYGLIYTPQHSCEIVSATEVHEVKGTDAGAVSLQLEKLTGTQAPGAGATILSTAFNLKGTINTVQIGAFAFPKTNTVFNINATAGVSTYERLAFKLTGTPTAVAGVQVTLYFHRIGKGHYN